MTNNRLLAIMWNIVAKLEEKHLIKIQNKKRLLLQMADFKDVFIGEENARAILLGLF